jgi:hypothetical protein
MFKHILFVFLVLFVCSSKSFAQYIKMSTLSSWSGKSSNNGNYMSAVVGQSSVIAGTSKNQGLTLRQGFKQPLVFSKKVRKTGGTQLEAAEVPWSFITFPNPFIDQLTVRFDKNTNLPVRIVLVDLDANILFEEVYPENIREVKLEKFKGIPAGKYILQVFQRGQPQTKSLIKDVQ